MCSEVLAGQHAVGSGACSGGALGNASAPLALKGIARSAVRHGCVASSCKQLMAERARLACCDWSYCVYHG